MKLDEIGRWSEIKLEIIREYSEIYTGIMHGQRFKSQQQFKIYYIDAFSGAGIHLRKKTREKIYGSPLIVLNNNLSFNKYYFIDSNSQKIKFLRKRCDKEFIGRDVETHKDDCNKIIKDIISNMSYGNFDRVLCFLDPYGLHLDWKVIELMGGKGIVDLILNFPIMDMNRNALRRNPEKVSKKNFNRMTQFWGDTSWRDAAYKEPAQATLFGDLILEKQRNEAMVNAFRDRLKDVAQFRYVLEPILLKNSKDAPIYYLFFASQNATAERKAKKIFKKYAGL